MFVVSNFRFYLDNKLVIGDPSTQIKDSSLEFLALELRFFGGTVSDSLDKKVSHVMVDKRSEPKFNSQILLKAFCIIIPPSLTTPRNNFLGCPPKAQNASWKHFYQVSLSFDKNTASIIHM